MALMCHLCLQPVISVVSFSVRMNSEEAWSMSGTHNLPVLDQMSPNWSGYSQSARFVSDPVEVSVAYVYLDSF